jgi:hypothetical protein
MVGMGLVGRRKMAAGVGRENEGRRKKEVRRKKGARCPMYNTRAPTSSVPFAYYRVPGRLAPFL